MGRLLAEKLGFAFLDTDPEIERECGQSIADMVAEHGWAYFRKVEQKFLESLIDRTDLVIAPGGGAILHQDVWEKLMKTSFVVWLKADVQTVCRRLAGDALSASQRPSLTGQDMIKEVQSVLLEREPLYENGCHLSISTESSLEEIVDEILTNWAGISR